MRMDCPPRKGLCATGWVVHEAAGSPDRVQDRGVELHVGGRYTE